MPAWARSIAPRGAEPGLGARSSGVGGHRPVAGGGAAAALEDEPGLDEVVEDGLQHLGVVVDELALDLPLLDRPSVADVGEDGLKQRLARGRGQRAFEPVIGRGAVHRLT